MIDLRVRDQQIGGVLRGAPSINDQLNSVCRTLEIPVRHDVSLENYLGDTVELWRNGERWFVGLLRKRGADAAGNVSYVAYDPLYFMAKNPDDFDFVNLTGTGIIKKLAQASGVRISPKLENTGAVLQPLYYQGKAPSAIAIDVLARTYYANGKKYWYRYDPSVESEGLTIFERVVPSEVWAFQVGVNLTSANITESIESVATVVKLVNRETGREVIKKDSEKLAAWGPTVHFAQVNKDEAADMDRKASELLKKLSGIVTTISMDGINPDDIMPQFYSGDVVYIEEPTTGLLGAYHIINAKQEITTDNLVMISLDVQIAPDIPEIVYTDAEKPKTGAVSPTKNTYDPEFKAAADKYGVSLTDQ